MKRKPFKRFPYALAKPDRRAEATARMRNTNRYQTLQLAFTPVICRRTPGFSPTSTSLPMEVAMHRTRNFALVVICAAAFLLSFTLPPAWAQKKPDAKTRSDRANGDTLFSSASAPNPDRVF